MLKHMRDVKADTPWEQAEEICGKEPEWKEVRCARWAHCACSTQGAWWAQWVPLGIVQQSCLCGLAAGVGV